MSIQFDVELFLVTVANSVAEFPNLQRSFDDYYKADSYRFYNRAKRSKLYDHPNISWQPLESGEAMRRAFGVLLCAEEDGSIRDFVCERLLETDKRFTELVKKPGRKLLDTFITDVIEKMQTKPGTDEAKNAPMCFLAYMFYATYGTGSENQTVTAFLSHTHKLNLELIKRKTCYSDKLNQSLNKNGVAKIPKKSQTLIRQLKSGHDLFSFLLFREEDAKTVSSQQPKTGVTRHLCDYYKLGSEEEWDAKMAMRIVEVATYISSVVGVDLNGLRGPSGITQDEQNIIIRMLADMYPGATASELSRQISVSNYTMSLVFMLLVKEIRNTKEFYYKNNSETQLLEQRRLDNIVEEQTLEIERLRTELDSSNVFGERQKEEIRRLTEMLSKENKDAVKPFESEISALNSRVRELEKTLESEQAKTLELNALREFAFAARSDYIPTETTVTLAELISGKRVIIIGGNVNWQNKIRERYPAITVLDGHSVSFDNSMFDKADFILFNTASMSHKAYYRAIGYLRDRKLRFGYLGRSQNHELLEAEIVSILQDKLLTPILGINDPRTDERIDFIGGMRGLAELEKRVDSGEMAAAFSLFPTSMEQLMSTADAGDIMPPKSTWFEPKLKSGLFVHWLS